MCAQSKDISLDKVFVVTDCRITGDLLCNFLKSSCNLSCNMVEKIENLPEAPKSGQSLVLIDCHNQGKDFVVDSIDAVRGLSSRAKIIALFDLSSDLEVENTALIKGVRGFLYSTDSSETFKKALHSMLRGELWISRFKLTQFLTQSNLSIESGGEDLKSSLTKREKEILLLLVDGAKNHDIADRLSISPHTVKSHLFNIFKKIDVPNRVKAALWASKNPQELEC